MKYFGTRGMEVTIDINMLPAAYTNEELLKSGILSAIAKNGHIFKVMIPENIKTIDDARFIAFEAVTGFTYDKEMSEYFSLSLKNIRYLGNDIVFCMTVAEFNDYNVDKLKEYIKEVENKKEE